MKVLFWTKLELKEWKKHLISNKAAKTNENNENLNFKWSSFSIDYSIFRIFTKFLFPQFFHILHSSYSDW